MAGTTTTATWTIGKLLNWTRDYLESKAVDEPRLAAELLLSCAMGCRKIELYTRFEQVPAAPQVDAFRALVQEAAQHKPIAYLVGRKEFYSLEFEVSPAVLIPRPETESIVERAVSLAKAAGRDPFHVLDVGTGSGCIAVAIARFAPAARVTATDVSADALAVAQRNVTRHGMDERVRLVQADGLAFAEPVRPDGGFDLLVANPPYIADGLRETLAANVRDYEPAVALFGGADGLDLMRRLAADGPSLLRRGATALIEIASGMDNASADVFTSAGWTHRETIKDAAGIPRVLVLEIAA